MSEKLNLNRSAVEFHWKQEDPRLLKVLSVMEGVESWALDDVESVARELVTLGKKMSAADPRVLGDHSEEVITVMTYIFSGKALRILNWLDETHPTLSFHLVVLARQREDEGWKEGNLLLDRIKVLANIKLLSGVFTPRRAQLITEALAEDDDD